MMSATYYMLSQNINMKSVKKQARAPGLLSTCNENIHDLTRSQQCL